MNKNVEIQKNSNRIDFIKEFLKQSKIHIHQIEYRLVSRRLIFVI
jgi:hypothetical protein